MIPNTRFRPSSISSTFRPEVQWPGNQATVVDSFVPAAPFVDRISLSSRDRRRARSLPFEVHCEGRWLPVGPLPELAPDRGLCVRSKSRAAHTHHSHAVSYRSRLSKVHMPDRNHLRAWLALPGSAARLDPFRSVEWKKLTSRKVSGRGRVPLAFHRCGTPRTVPGRLARGFPRR